MKKIIILFLLVSSINSCLVMESGTRTIYSSHIENATEDDYIKGMDLFWERYPEFRLDSICKQEIKTKYFTIYKGYLYDGGGDSISYFRNPKSLYPYAWKSEYTTIRTYYMKSLNDSLIYDVGIYNCVFNKCELGLALVHYRYSNQNINGRKYDNNQTPEMQNQIANQFKKEIADKIDIIVKELVVNKKR